MTKSVSINNKPTVNVDSTTPIDVDIQNAELDINVTNTVSTNATIQGTPNVNVSNVVSVDDSTPIDTNITNSYVNVYNKLYNDGANAWVSQQALDGRALSYVQTKYDYDTRLFLSQTTDINTWIDAFSDGVLVKKYVQNYHTDGQEQDVYLTHPYVVNAGSSKCLHLIYQYTTVNNIEVVESVWAKVDDWTFDDEIAGTVSITAGAVTSPAVDAAAGTDVCTLTATNNSLGDIVVSLSGTNASLYQLNDGVTTGSSITNPSTPLVIETASLFNGSSYSHSVTATITGSTFNITDSVTIQTSGTVTTPSSFSNTKHISGPPIHSVVGVYNELSNGGLLSPNTTFNDYSTNSQTYNFYLYKPSAYSGEIALLGDFTGPAGYCFFCSSSYGDLVFYSNAGTLYRYAGINLPSGFEDTWIMVTFVTDPAITSSKFYLQNSSTFNNTAYSCTITTGTTGYVIPTTNSISNSSFYGARTYANAIYPGSSAGMSSNTFKLDEYTAWNKALSLSEIEELHNNFTTYDYSTHSANADLYRWIRFGDGSNDSESSVQCQIDNTFILDKNSSATNTYITNLTASDAPYVPASGAWANDYYALGTSTSANIKLHADYDLSQSWTISFWVYAAAFSGKTHLGAFHPITSLFTSSHTDAIHASYYPAGIYVSERNNIQSGNPNYFGLTEPNSGSFVGYSTQFDRTYTSGWHNVIVTWDSTYYNASSISQANVKAGLTYYYDNVAVGKDTDSNASGSINPANFIFTGLQFGSHSATNHTNAYNGGRLDGVAIWTSHLVTSAERTHIYNNGTPQDLMNTTNLTSPTKYWLMEDDTDLAYDIKNSTSNEGSSTDFTRTAH